MCEFSVYSRDLLTIKVNDQVTGYCPACPCPQIEIAYDTGVGSRNKYEVQKYVLRCVHQDVCYLRREYMGRN